MTKTHTVFMPAKPTAEMLRILADADSPFLWRMRYKRNGERDGWEVRKLENADWREVVPETSKLISRHKSGAGAAHRYEVEIAKWKYEQLMKLGV